MLRQDHPTGAAALAARWREDAQVFRRYGATGRARLVERMAAEMEQSAAAATESLVELAEATALTGYSRSHLRRLVREGKLIPTATERGEPRFRQSELPRKPGGVTGSTIPHPDAYARAAREAIRIAKSAARAAA